MALHLARRDFIDIEPGSMSAVHTALHSGRLVAIDHGPHDVATTLRELHDELHLHYDPHEDVWVVMQKRHLPDGSVSEHLVTSAKTCDERLVMRVREVIAPGYDLLGEIEKAERAAERANQAEKAERFGDVSERLSHAFRKDLSRHEVPRTVKSRAFFPKGG